jgi:hypothetical protein
MPAVLVIEDGTAATQSANSYVTVAEVTTFCTQYGLSSWADVASGDKITAILRAMAFIDSEYDFKGQKLSYDNPLEWPRFGIYEDVSVDPSVDLLYYKEIPKGLKNAVCRAAYEESVSAGVLQANTVSNIRSETVDVISTTYFGMTPSKTIYKTIEGFLKGLLKDKNSVSVRRT